MTPAMRRRARSIRMMWSVIDASVWFAAIWVATWLRLDLSIPNVFVRGALVFAVAAVIGHLVVGYLIGPYAVGHLSAAPSRRSSTCLSPFSPWGRACSCGRSWLGQSCCRAACRSARPRLAIVVMFALRFVVRTARSRAAKARRGERRAVIMGAGDAGRRLLRNLVADPSSGIVPVALLDDDKSKARLRVEGVRVRGTREQLREGGRERTAPTCSSWPCPTRMPPAA